MWRNFATDFGRPGGASECIAGADRTLLHLLLCIKRVGVMRNAERARSKIVSSADDILARRGVRSEALSKGYPRGCYPPLRSGCSEDCPGWRYCQRCCRLRLCRRFPSLYRMHCHFVLTKISKQFLCKRNSADGVFERIAFSFPILKKAGIDNISWPFLNFVIGYFWETHPKGKLT